MVSPPPAQRIELGQAVREYLRVCEQKRVVGDLAASTVRNYTDDLREFVQLIGAQVVADDVDGPMVDDAVVAYGKEPDRRYRDDRRPEGARRSPATQKRFRQSVSMFFSHAQLQGWVQRSPLDYSVVKPRVRGGLRTERKSLQVHQLEALLEHGPGEPVQGRVERSHERNYERDAYLLSLMAVLGPRVSEVVSANRVDFASSPEGVTWRIVGKGGKERTLPMSPRLIELRDAYQAVRPGPSEGLSAAKAADGRRAELVSGRGGRLSSRDVERIVDRAYRRVLSVSERDARALTPHALRHTAATLLLAAGWDVKVVQKLLGHSSLATTSKYLDEVDDELVVAVRNHPVLGSSVPEGRSDVVEDVPESVEGQQGLDAGVA